MSKSKIGIQKTEIEIEVDKITNSIENLISGDTFDTEVVLVNWTEKNTVTQNFDWLFDWKSEYRKANR